MDRPCRVCGNAKGNVGFAAREAMFGTGESFEYLECAQCGCLQIDEIPRDLSRYYPSEYYALSTRTRRPRRSLRRRAQKRISLLEPTLFDRCLSRLWGLPDFAGWARAAGIGLDAAVLDVGSGTGNLLHKMADFGFTDLTGIDPNVEGDRVSEDGVRIFKRELAEEDRRYDFIMFNHTLEHLPDPHKALADARRALNPGRAVLVRVPVKDSLAWEQYGIHWVQLDAPRHLYLFTKESLRKVAEGAGFKVERITHDSTAFQFWGSELCRRDVPLSSAETRERSPRHHFSKAELRGFRRRAKQLNREGRGDSACFYLRNT